MWTCTFNRQHSLPCICFSRWSSLPSPRFRCQFSNFWFLNQAHLSRWLKIKSLLPRSPAEVTSFYTQHFLMVLLLASCFSHHPWLSEVQLRLDPYISTQDTDSRNLRDRIITVSPHFLIMVEQRPRERKWLDYGFTLWPTLVELLDTGIHDLDLKDHHRKTPFILSLLLAWLFECIIGIGASLSTWVFSMTKYLGLHSASHWSSSDPSLFH